MESDREAEGVTTFSGGVCCRDGPSNNRRKQNLLMGLTSKSKNEEKRESLEATSEQKQKGVFFFIISPKCCYGCRLCVGFHLLSTEDIILSALMVNNIVYTFVYYFCICGSYPVEFHMGGIFTEGLHLHMLVA